ncbi:transposase (plasmid) [Paenibacillus cellulosilyticus]|nr:transposase [Paenibacillus cellulosilyticus]
MFSREGYAAREGRWLLWLTVPRSKAKPLFTADRGHESYNNFAHIECKGWNYVIRVKDLDSSGILSGVHLPSSEAFDKDIHLILTRKQTKEVKAHPEIYRFVSISSTFDFWIYIRIYFTQFPFGLFVSSCLMALMKPSPRIFRLRIFHLMSSSPFITCIEVLKPHSGH